LRRSFLDDGRLIEPTPEDFDQAWSAYGRGLAGEAGIIDHVSFVVMRRLGLTQAFTNDAHFRAAGFEVLF
jgi:predicted nucleic acid-binding protein